MTTEIAQAVLANCDGLHIGLLSATELEALDVLVRAGLAQRDYSGPAGLLGLGKVRLL